jgi:N-acyl homoserine lactone hydrolase
MLTTASPQRLYLMRVATLPAPDHTPAVCYLVQMSDGRNILIDSGLPEQLPPGMPSLVLEATVLAHLAALGLQPDDIDILICTHFDLDHAGRHGAFPRATLAVQRTHLAAALREPRFAATRTQWEQPAERYQLLDGDTTLLPGLDLIETSGHVPGHQSVLVRLPLTGPVLLTIDAVPDQASFTPQRQPGPRDMDARGTRASTQKLLDVAQRVQAALVIFGHDGAQWQTLKLAPDCYE